MADPIEVPLAIVGAGPAGLAAALTATQLGVTPIVFDDNPLPGGQIYRRPPADFEVVDANKLGSDFRKGGRLLEACREAGIEIRSEATVWSLDRDRRLEVSSLQGLEAFLPRCVILATGAHDRPVPFPGWTLPGVFTVGGAQNLLKSQRLLVGQDVVLSGTGPLLLVVACQLAKAGARVRVADPVARWAPVGELAALLRQWPLLVDGLRYHATLLRRRARWHSRSVLVRVDGNERVERVTLAAVDRCWRPIDGTETSYPADAVCIGYGLVPSIELARMAGCEVAWDEATSTWLPVRDGRLETSVDGVFAVGDGAGVAGAVTAAQEGVLAGIAVARRLGCIDREEELRRQGPHRHWLARLKIFQSAMERIYRLGPGLLELATPETLLCRCEEVSAASVDEALERGPATLGAVKAWTRVTMGPCQGRMCFYSLADRIARARGDSCEDVLPLRARPPAKPLRLETVDRPAEGSEE